LKTNIKFAAAVIAVSAMALAGCSSSSSSTESSAAAPASSAAAAEESAEPSAEASAEASAAAASDVKACEVTDVGGVDDKGFNQKAYKGVTDAAEKLGVEAAVLESQAETDYATNIQSFVDQECDVIVTVGFLLGDATKEAANANPDTPFTIVDYAYADGDITNNNVLGQVFNTDEAAFLAGYLAAGTTKTGKVGTFGGINIPPVTIFMDGFYYGVQKYNADNGTKVEVLGWDPKKQKGLFTENFESLDDGRTFAQNLVDEGADIVMPVAGPVGLGSAALASELGTDKLMIIGVDSDQYESDTANAGVYLTSVLKNMDVTTFNAIQSVVDGTFEGGVTVGTLENGGVGLAPLHDMEASVPADLVAQLDTIKAGIIDGSISVKG
jgi:basic membrane protein A and related proteins